MIGDSCVANEQCTWDGHHGLCRERVCTCEEGYIAAYSGCYQGNSSWFKNIMKTCTFDTVNAVILKNFLRELVLHTDCTFLLFFLLLMNTETTKHHYHKSILSILIHSFLIPALTHMRTYKFLH